MNEFTLSATPSPYEDRLNDLNEPINHAWGSALGWLYKWP